MSAAGVRRPDGSAAEPPPRATTSACWSPRAPAISHHRFLDLPDLLEPGDLLVVNTSATARPRPSTARRRAFICRRRCRATGRADGRERWVIELRDRRRAAAAAAAPGSGSRCPAAARPSCSRPTSAAPAPVGGAVCTLPEPLLDYLAGTASRSATATTPGRARWPTTRRLRRPSRAAPRCRAPGRPFTAEPCSRRSRTARHRASRPIVLHAGVSSLELGERPYPERFRVPARPRSPPCAPRRRG